MQRIVTAIKAGTLLGWMFMMTVSLVLATMAWAIVRINSTADNIENIQVDNKARGETIRDLSLTVASALAPSGCIFKEQRTESNANLPAQFQFPVEPGPCLGPGRAEAGNILKQAIAVKEKGK